ncbi:MAG TPA: helical backbone metal receptor [Syntrophales bacterium]|nr:helical backbone metal receptor [Syntrophales bacterium]
MALGGTALAAPPERIVSLAPNLTEILYDIGLGDRVVAVTDFCDYPPDVKNKPKIGGFSTPSLEAVAAMKPDMVVMTKDGNPPEFAERLKRIGIRLYVFDVRRINELPRGIRELGAALDVAQAAKKRADRIENLLGQYETQAKKKASSGIRSALFIVQPEPPIVAGPGTLIDDSFRLLGLRNIAAGASSEYPRYSIEMIIHGAPDVILMGSMGRGIPSGDTTKDPLARGLFNKLSSLEAVKAGRICYTSDAVFRLGPRIVDGIREIAACTGRL